MGARNESVQQVAEVGSVKMFVRATAGCALAWMICDPTRVGVAKNRD